MHQAFPAHHACVLAVVAEKRYFRAIQLIGHSIGQAPQVSRQYDIVFKHQCHIEPVCDYLLISIQVTQGSPHCAWYQLQVQPGG